MQLKQALLQKITIGKYSSAIDFSGEKGLLEIDMI
jgi:hypothetical protein